MPLFMVANAFIDGYIAVNHAEKPLWLGGPAIIPFLAAFYRCSTGMRGTDNADTGGLGTGAEYSNDLVSLAVTK
eukprot:2645207-Rhodomonas_salina.1